MRLWSLHPKYLDPKGLVALWREGLLAQKVLQGETTGYLRHPQLLRFRESGNPLGAIASYLRHVAAEADVRGYSFDRSKIVRRRLTRTIPVSDKQAAYEYEHLLAKLQRRDREFWQRLQQARPVLLHPLFHKVPGEIASWERY